ncbi:hypothetical protein AeMF1_006398 [Aphanomyces euteiches]|nr:hypothetical protein AeMF1_006398 [Aphanomyces euteiches]
MDDSLASRRCSVDSKEFALEPLGSWPNSNWLGRCGIPADIAEAVDPITLFTLVSTAEALISAGITDPYEFYQYVHVSEVGNSSGSGVGGMRSLRPVFLDRANGINVPSDTLQETFRILLRG